MCYVNAISTLAADLDSNLDSNPDSECYVKGGFVWVHGSQS